LGSQFLVDSAGEATTTQLYITGLAGCDTIDTDANGNLVCGTDADAGGSSFAWTPQSWGNSTSTVLGFMNGFITNEASSTIVGGLKIVGNSTTTNATTTSFNTTAFRINSESFTDLTGTGLELSTGALSVQDIYLRNTGDTGTGDYTFDTNTLFIDYIKPDDGLLASAFAAMLPAQIKSETAACVPTATLTNGAPVAVLTKSAFEIWSALLTTPAATIGANADPTNAEPTATAASFFMVSPFIFVSPRVFYKKSPLSTGVKCSTRGSFIYLSVLQNIN